MTDTDEERRAALTGALALALVPYAAGTPLAERLRIVYVGPAATVATDAEDDPWNYWVFTLEAGGGLGGESRQREYDLRGVTRASRTTEAWKLFLRFEAEYSREEFELDEDSVFVDARTELSLFGLTVWSLGPHWSVGALADAEQSTFDNFDLAIETGTAIEFSVFPYAESTRRAITIQYAAGLGFYNYEEETVFGELQETLALHQLDGAVHVQQPWGNIRMGLGARQFLHDPARYRVDLFGRLSLRIFRGFNFNVFGNVARVKDQINLPAGDLPPEEILIQRRLLGTDFEYDVRLSFSYTFGSIFNNIVNPRF